ncbi:leucine-rich repeat-containing protein 7 isoform X1 [Trematomus bernacchii]|nr:leucine-rich repeat-containing protein 7 isoform X1 [Trematomus bernacchii]XP_034002805.1 leucine-rich repeat-containing protein 7 isoform X1 [Trematomus bernacchii]XP_034002806.1 leucine-rich repeat-containing protein 7 isoform X1 [Trematomus bernacchii]XP_034002807.1 leucine-rich repeat-containing protein 7 isoform X1 [Trematomus bernacchii]XP_034002808.1 leucine-rich repeat-containing protein 7 isoform X1 [Trematomus bernacchii]XP_034002809.1 leucine-rich repeat-containing protein 7 isof
MTTKRKLIGRLVPCRCFRGEEEVISVLDYSHCSLQQVPKEIFSFERTLEELYLDANQIEELPKQLFNCQALKKLSMPDNDLSNLPTTIASLVNLKELDISKNGIQEFPDNIKCCKGLSVVEASVNPITKLPDGFTQLLNLTQLFLNDAFLEYLPANFGRLSKLRILELRENHLKTMPKSIHRLTQLERLDLGSNEFTEMPEVLEQIHNLKELWLDNNSLQCIPGAIGKLRQLRYFDLAKNRIESLDTDISGCEALEDLLLSSNMLQQLPDSIGMLKKLTTLKVDDNQLTSLPNTIGSPKPKHGLSLLEEFDCSCNELESLPPTIGYLHNLRTFAADENFLIELPREIGNCKNVTVMSMRSNKLEFLPDEIGQMTKLRVLNLSDNRLKNLPFTFTKLKDLAALWLSDNQSKALIPLQTEAHPETKQKVLTNYMFPQQPRHDEDYQSDSDSFNPILWEEQRQQRMTVAFDFEDKKEEEDNSGKVKVEINLKRYPTPYPEDLKNMVKSVQSLVGKSVHGGHGHQHQHQHQLQHQHQHQLSTGTATSAGTNMEHTHLSKEYEPPWPLPPKEVIDREMQDFSQSQLMDQGSMHNSGIDIPKRKDKEDLTESSEDSMGGSPNDIRISDMRPTLVEPPMYKPKVVLLGKDKKESTDEEVDKLHCLNHSGSSATYSDYSPSQGSSGSSNPPGNTHSHAHAHSHQHQHQHAHAHPHAHPHTPALPAPSKDQAPQTHWTNRLAQSFPKPIDSKPLLSQRETPPSGTLQQRGDRRPLSEPFDWAEAPHYDNTGFDAEESPMDPSSTSQGNPPLGSKPRSQSAHGRRPLLRQERIVGVPLELDTQTLPFHGNQRSTPDNDQQSSGHSSQNPWQNWTRTPSPLEDRTAFPSKLDLTPTSSPNPDRKDIDQRLEQGAGPLPGSWTYHDNQGDQNRKDQLSVSGGNKVTVVMSKSSDRLSPMMRETRSKFKKSQSIDEIDIGSYKVYSIPVDSYSASIEQQTSLDRQEFVGSMEQTNMSRSQSAPMLDDDLIFPGHGGSNQSGQNQKPAIPHKAYHFDHNYNPQVTIDRRVPPPFPNTPDYVNHSSKALEYINQPGKTLPKELVSPRYRAYPPLEMFSFPQSPINPDGPPSQHQQPIPSQRSRPGFLRRADSLVSSTELALFRRVHEAQQEALQEAQYRQQADPPLYGRALAYSSAMEHSAISNMSDSQSQMMHNKRNGRYDDDYTTYQEQKKPMIGYPTKSLTQRRPLSARSYSTETYGASQARPVSARPTMAALLEKMPPDYTLATCPEKPSEDTIKVRPGVPQKPEDITSRMPADWRQQLLRHIEAKRLDRSGVLKHNTLTLGMLCQGGGHGQGRSSTLNFNLYNNTKHESPVGRWLPLPPPPSANASPSQQAAMLDNDQEGLSGSNQWAPYSLGRRDVPPDNLMKKSAHSHNTPHQSHNTMIVASSTSSSSTTPHRVVVQQGYDGMMNKGGQYQPAMPLSVVPSGQYQGNMTQGHPGPGQGYPGGGMSMALSPSGNQPQYNPHSSHTSHQPATNPQYHGNQGMVHGNQGMVHGNQGMVHSNQGIVHGNQGMVHGNQGMVHSNQVMVHSNQGMVHSNQGMVHSNQGMVHTNQGMVHSNQAVMTHTNPRPQSARCLLQTKGQKSTDGFQEQLCVRIEKNPGLGFSISGGISGQGNPFKPSDMGIFVTRVQHDGPATSTLQPGDKILQANGHSFLHMEHETAVSLLKSFQPTVDLVVLREK